MPFERLVDLGQATNKNLIKTEPVYTGKVSRRIANLYQKIHYRNRQLEKMKKELESMVAKHHLLVKQYEDIQQENTKLKQMLKVVRETMKKLDSFEDESS